MPFYILNFHKPIHFTLLDIVLHYLLKTQLPWQPLTPYYKVPLIIKRHQPLLPLLVHGGSDMYILHFFCVFYIFCFVMLIHASFVFYKAGPLPIVSDRDLRFSRPSPGGHSVLFWEYWTTMKWWIGFPRCEPFLHMSSRIHLLFSRTKVKKRSRHLVEVQEPTWNPCIKSLALN
jgi:hypothetical protein